MNEKKPQFFLRVFNSGEPAFHCGGSPQEAAQAIATFLLPEIEEELKKDNSYFDVRINRVDMTDQEVEEIPEL